MYLLVNNKRYTEIDKQGKEVEIEFKSLIKKGNDLLATTVEDRKFTIGNANWNNLSVEGGEFETKVTKEELLLKEIANLKLENKKKDLIAKNLMQQVAEIRLNLKKEGN